MTYELFTDLRLTDVEELIDGIGSIAKSILFGTMDANDEKLINEQIQLLQNKQLTLQQAGQNNCIKYQITVLNTMIAHIENIETIID